MALSEARETQKREKEALLAEQALIEYDQYRPGPFSAICATFLSTPCVHYGCWFGAFYPLLAFSPESFPSFLRLGQDWDW